MRPGELIKGHRGPASGLRVLIVKKRERKKEREKRGRKEEGRKERKKEREREASKK